MEAREPHAATAPTVLLSELYDDALPEVFAYVRSRCGSAALAEELTSATFVKAAVEQSRGRTPQMTIAWLVTVARNLLIDHWRREAVASRSMTLLEGGQSDSVDPWDDVLDHTRAAQVLQALPPQYRGVLTLRYLDDLSVPECADILQRTVHATESLLVRARTAFRAIYEETGGDNA